MAVGEGKFQLYSFIDPPLQAGTYRFRTDQLLSADGATGNKGPTDLPVEQLDTFVRIRSPRYQLPPDQVLSTFPPANAEGSFGARLPQIVIKRRTLPWERDLAGQPSTTPWLALVLIAEGEAELKMNQPVADCVTPGMVLDGIADSELGNYLSVRKSVIDKVLPTQKDVPLLAHAREVDINDTELMMGDDDGFLAVVVSNRLPVPARDADGNEVPVKYLACLVNLEGQFSVLLPEAPPQPPKFTIIDTYEYSVVDVAGWDHVVSGHDATAVNPVNVVNGVNEINVEAAGGAPLLAAEAAQAGGSVTKYTALSPSGAQAYQGSIHWTLDDAVQVESNVYVEMAQDFLVADASYYAQALDPVYRFPVLLHWSFTSVGDTTFKLLMEQVDSQLFGGLADPNRPTLGDHQPAGGRPPIEVVETGHVGLPNRTRRGDEVRIWYRGPFVAHPTVDPPGGRLGLAHASDQLRIIVPDGREDLSLAAAFEIGRLLALSKPAIVGSLLRWRQSGYQAARGNTIWGGFGGLLGEFFGEVEGLAFDSTLPLRFGREFVKRAADAPGELIGPPRGLFDPGRPINVDGDAPQLLADGFGFGAEVLSGTAFQMLDGIRNTEVPVFGAMLQGLDQGQINATLRDGLDRALTGLVSGTLANGFMQHPVAGPTIPLGRRRAQPVADRLDELLDAGHFDERANRAEDPR